MYFRGSANSSSVGRKVVASGIPCVQKIAYCKHSWAPMGIERVQVNRRVLFK